MKRISICVLLVAFSAGTAFAQDGTDTEMEDPLAESATEETPVVSDVDGSTDVGSTGGPLGLGITGLLAGGTGAELVYRITPKVQAVGFLGVNFFSPDAGDSQIALVTAAACFYRLAGTSRASLHAGLRVDLGIANAADTSVQFNIEAPLRAEFALTDEIVLHAETGLVVAFVPDEGSVFGPDPAGATVIKLGGQLLGSFGLTLFL